MERDRKIFKILVIAFISIIIIGLCFYTAGIDSIPNNNEFDNDFEILHEYNIDSNKFYEVRNKNTGVHYYINKGSITPVYTFSGTVKTTEHGEQ